MVSTMPFRQPGATTLFQNFLLIFWQPCANLFPVSGFPHVAGAGRSPHMWPFASGPITDLLVCSAIFPTMCVTTPKLHFLSGPTDPSQWPPCLRAPSSTVCLGKTVLGSGSLLVRRFL